jgi:hypothetical protein
VGKRKKSSAPFEVFSRNVAKRPAGISVPHVPGPTPAEEAARGEPAEGVRRAARTAPEGDAGPQREPIVSTADGRLRVSLNYISSVVVGGGVVLLLIAAFVLGRVTAPEGGPQAAAAGGTTPGRTVKKTPKPTREAGKWYLVIEAMPGLTDEDYEHAKRIAEFCEDRGDEYATIEKCRIAGGDVVWAVWSLTGFDAKDDPRARQHARVVATMGQEYFDTHGTYRFQPAGPDARWPWFIQHEPRTSP